MKLRLLPILFMAVGPLFAAVEATKTVAVPAPAASVTQTASSGIPNPWTNAAFQKVMAESGRPLTLTDADFQAIQDNKKLAIDHIQNYLVERFKSADPKLVRAFSELPREYYQWNYKRSKSFAQTTYEWPAKPWAIGYGSFLSDYAGQAYMIHLAHPKPGDTALEIGTGSGYNSSLLSRLVKKSYSIEIITPLGNSLKKIFKPMGLTNVQTRVGDGYFGWPEVSGGFDLIIVTCAAQYVPPDLLAQLKPHGRMVIPIGPPAHGKQVLYVYRKDAKGRVRSRKDMGVFFIPMTGQMQKQPAPDAAPVAEATSTSTTPVPVASPVATPKK